MVTIKDAYIPGAPLVQLDGMDHADVMFFNPLAKYKPRSLTRVLVLELLQQIAKAEKQGGDAAAAAPTAGAPSPAAAAAPTAAAGPATGNPKFRSGSTLARVNRFLSPRRSRQW